MNATITFPIDPIIKKKAKENVEKQGYSFDVFVAMVVNELLTVVAEKESSEGADILIHLDKPSRYLKHAIKKAREDRKAGKASPTFTNAEEAIKWLNK